ncbi:hypothetical protein SAICODRAFT_8850 [Saitoella complicata NRRL Y-17804]|nr:uncharacterized protein SAICODRAFT_8850 [Saitoella complicata NRRL Y-17804]ODQ51554.1 hypothetical protein SAICODRAFT_8850 [Saitoella complicata NRRL Y-17804]
MIKNIRRSLKTGSTSSSNGGDKRDSNNTSSTSKKLLIPKKVIRALYDYTPQSTQELGFKKGDFFHVIGNENDADWYEACNPATDTRGFVPVPYFEVLGKTDGRRSGPLQAPPGARDSDSGFREDGNAAKQRYSSTSSTTKMAPLYGIVQYDFAAERPDELDAKAGEAIIVIAQSNHEWFVAKPIGRLGGPGLIPVSFIEIRDVTTGQPIENVEELVSRAGVPRVEEWKKMTAEYKEKSIPLGSFNFSNQNQNRPPTGSSIQGSQNSAQDSRPTSAKAEVASLPVVGAKVERYMFDGSRYWFLIKAEMEDGRHRNLCRYYEDFHDFQLSLLEGFPTEAGKNGDERILPFMPGPLSFVDDSISSQRQADLDVYVQELCRLPRYILQGDIIKTFFEAREGDVESTHATNLIPQPAYRQLAVPNAQGNRTSKTSHRSSDRSHYSRTSNAETPLPSSTGALPPVPPQPSRSPSNSMNMASVQEALPPVAPAAAADKNMMPPPPAPMARNWSAMTTATTVSGDSSNPSRLQTPASASTTSIAGSSGAPPPYIKIKVFFNDDLIAIRVPRDVTFQALSDKLRDRLGGVQSVRWKDENAGELLELRDDEDLGFALRQSGPKVVLYAK